MRRKVLKAELAELCSSRTNLLKSYSYNKLFKRLRSLFSDAIRDKHHKGRVRTFVDAKTLGVIDKRVERLVGIMNQKDLISTIGSCQGHGFPFIKVPPYVSFKTRTDIAAKIQSTLKQHSDITHRNLNYCWTITPCINDNSLPVYVLEIPALSTGKLRRATRSRIDQDLKLIELISQKILDHFSGKKVEIKC